MQVGFRHWRPIFLFFSFILIFFLSYLILEPETPLLSPLAEGIIRKLTHEKMKVVGFLPYWNISSDYQVKVDEIDQLIYFGLKIDKEGRVIKKENGWLEPGFNKFKSPEGQNIFQIAKNKKKKVLLSFISFDADLTDSLLSSDSAKNRLIEEMVNLVEENDLDGVDIDFEYFPSADNLPDFGEQFNQFLAELKLALKRIKPKAILSVDIYPKAVIYNWPYQLPEMSKIVDQVIIMAYDYTQSNSMLAGPVSPLRGLDENEYSVVKTVEAALKFIPKEKLILGLPLYGYEWRTVSHEPRSKTYRGSGVLASYERVKKLIKEQKIEVKWDEVASSPWLVYKQGREIRQIYFDNLKSLALKIELAQQLQFKGLGFWALGYEGNSYEFWQFLRKKLAKD